MTDRRSVLTAGAALATASPTAAAPRGRRARLYPVLEAIMQAWMRQDIEGVLAHVPEDIIWRNSSGYAPAVVGKEAMRAVLTRMAGMIARDDWRNFDYAESAHRLFVEGVDEFWLTTGQHVAVPYAGVFEFRDLQICEWREYFDGRISADMKAGAPMTDEVHALISRPAIAARR